MPRSPLRPLCLPELVASPQTRADYIEANPPKFGPSGSRPPSLNDTTSFPIPPSPTSLKSFDSHRTSGLTAASLASPVATASTRTSLSVHNLPWNGESGSKRTSALSGMLSKAGIGTESSSKGWTLSSITSGLAEAATDKKPRASWSSAFGPSKSWFGGATPSEAEKPSTQKQIKLSPSMIAATAAVETPKAARPYSYPFPATRSPRVGTGLQYYTEQNPAPSDVRVQIPDPVSQDPPPAVQPFTTPVAASHVISVSPITSVIPQERPLESIPTRSLTHDSNVPDIRVSSGDI
ncbi:hypothetical protein M422DRAFT_258852 [Sphaerobolus stellatus SS14]|uniref:Uncharacterized protein n=1 Tax=Sphaerobolus stellatus (strain SS14) TaxID=990650 RepID=A0A0C9U675_SPHS4|nr:hypothetical protein M422DRAFT_258852 [Sphaerobolus stellatus SS14]